MSFFLSVSITLAADTYAERTPLSLHLSNRTVANVLETIEEQTEFRFFYNSKLVDMDRKVSVSVHNRYVFAVLDQIFKDTNVRYKVVDKDVILTMVNQADPVMPDQSKKTIRGTVLDEFGEPVAGATIKVVGTTNGTATDMSGNFSLENVNDDSTLEISYIGYITQRVRISGDSPINVQLREDTQRLEEVVVVGYGTQKKINLTGSVSTVNFEENEVASRPITDISQALSNASPGLQIMQSSGEPNAESFSYNIRGTGTLNNSGPLILVDGMEASISMVNPSDIASISILKDAASCAIYGNRGANGVILITTKSGDEARISVNYDVTFSYSQPFKIIHTISDYVEYMKLMNESATNLGNSAMFSQSSIDIWEAANANPNGIAPSGYPNYVAYPNTDWWDEIYTKQWMQKHTVTLNGKEKRSGYSMSLSYIDNPGVVKKTGYERFMTRINLYSDITDWLRIGTRTWGNKTNREVSNSSQSGFFGTLDTQKMLPCTYPYYDGKYGAPEGPEDDPQSHNPLWDMAMSDGHDKFQQIYTDFYAQVKFLKYFTYNFDYFYNDRRRERKLVDPSIGKFSFSKGAYSTGADAPATLYSRMYYTRDNTNKLNHQLNYGQEFGDHDVAAMIGYEEQRYNYRETNAIKLGLTDAAINDLNAATTPYTTSGYGTQYSARSVFGRINYAFKSKYLFEANLRYDGSSRFAPDYRWGTFPSFSAGWRISEEEFMKNSVVNNMKLRLSWGKLGNNSIGNYDWQAVYSTANYSLGQALTSGISITAIANSALTWEETAVSNIGLDFGFLRNKLSGSIDVYNKLTTGILYTPDMYMVMGLATAPRENIAEVTNRGIEIELGWQDKVGKDFRYSIKGNVAFNKNLVSKYKGKLERGWNGDVYTSNIGDVSTGGTTRILEDHIISEWYLPNTYKGTGTHFKPDGSVDINGGPKDGMIRTEDDMKWLQAMKAAGYSFQPSNNIAKNGLWYGEYIYADSNGDGIYGNSYDSEFQGSSTAPKYNFGLSASAYYKNFDFSMNWGGAAGFSIYYYATSRNASTTIYGYTIPDAIAKDHYFYDPSNPSDPRTNLTSKQPRLVNTSGPPSSANSSLHLEKGDFLKLRNVTLGYTLPQALSRKFYVERLRIFTSGENLFAITGFSGQDPEMRTTVGYSTMRQFAFGLNVTF